MASRASGPAGFTLVEVLLVTTLLGIALAVAVPRWLGLQHRLASRGAAALLTRALFDARHQAARRGTRVAVRLDTTAGTVTVVATADTLARHDLQATFGVALAATRDSLAYVPSGLGFGASNARIVVTRGAAAETVTVSRIGRVRR